MSLTQLIYRESLRDIEGCLRSLEGKLYYLRVHDKVARSTMAGANESRDWRTFADSRKAVKKQIWIAVSAYVLAAIVRKRL